MAEIGPNPSFSPSSSASHRVEFAISAPGKVLLSGEHAVVFGKSAVAASLGLRTFVRVRCSTTTTHTPTTTIDYDYDDETDQSVLEQSRRFRVRLINFKVPNSDDVLQVNWSKSDLIRLETRVRPLLFDRSSDTNTDWQQDVLQNLQGMHLAFQAMLTLLFYTGVECIFNGWNHIDVDIFSELPIAAGLGSSGSYSVCIAAMLLRLANRVSSPLTPIHLNDDNHHNHQHNNNSSFPKSHLGRVIYEEQDVHHPTRQERELINELAFMSERIIHGTPSGVDNSISTFGGILLFTKPNIMMPLEGVRISAKDHFRLLVVNTRVPRNTAAVVARVRQLRNHFPTLVNPIIESIHNISLEWVKTLQLNTVENSPPTNGTLHTTLAALIDINHHLLCSLQVGHPTLDTIHRIAQEFGLSSKLTGAGGGGSAFILLPPWSSFSETRAHDLMERLKKEGFDVLPSCIGDVGVTFHRCVLLPQRPTSSN